MNINIDYDYTLLDFLRLIPYRTSLKAGLKFLSLVENG